MKSILSGVRAARRPSKGLLLWGFALLVVASAGLAQREAVDGARQARRILADTGVQGGLIVHLGCGDGQLTAGLRANDGCLVHGLDADAANVAKARAHIRSLGLYGKVSAEQWSGDRLPYADGTVNLVVAATLGRVPMPEVMRVLRPEGVAYVQQGSAWSKSVKPRPSGTDEWTHYLHDATGNAVAHDTVVGLPRRAQWLVDPRITRSHEHTPGVAALVSSNGRIFYLVDEADPNSVLRRPDWQLVARDAYNGVLLWKRPVPVWWPSLAGWTQGPRQLQRKLVAVGDRVYATLGLSEPLIAADAATGRTLRSYDETRGAEEIVCHQGVLLLALRDISGEPTAELGNWARLSREKDSPLYVRETQEPLLQRLRGSVNRAPVSLLALDADSGRVLWKKMGADSAGLRPLSLSALGDRAFYQRTGQVVGVDLKSGKELWAVPTPAPMRVVCERGVICADGKIVAALSLETGETAWTETPRLSEVRDAFIINGSLWLGGFKPFQGKNAKQGAPWGPYFVTQHDLGTGKVVKEIEPENPGHHHRCYANKATERFILGGRRGTEFIDLQKGTVSWNSFARGVCMYGVMPANGLLYAPPHACGCYGTAKLIGFYALAPLGATPAPPASVPLQRGPAYTGIPAPKAANDEWPLYRHDAGRSGTTTSEVPAALNVKWQMSLGGKLSAPTIAGGRVLVAAPDDHRVRALDAETGQPRWEFTAGGRVDSPPAFHAGRAIFGSRDGSVYALRATDGALSWRLRASRDERRIVACGQLESVSPAHGSVLIRDGVAYVTAGRSSYLDGGIDLCRVQPETGKLLSRTPIYSPDPKTGEQPPHLAPAEMPGVRTDLLSSDGQYVYLRDQVFRGDGRAQPAGNPHLFTVTDFLDETWPHRSYWIFGTKWSMAGGCSTRDKALIYGRIISFAGSTVFGYGRQGVHWSNQLQDGPYRLFALDREEGRERWSQKVEIQVRAMLLAGKVLFVAGPPLDAIDPETGPDESRGALLLALSAEDGSELGRLKLESLPAHDGMAAAYGRLYLTTTNGKVMCLAGAK